MIIGKGLIATAFEKLQKDKDLIVFASGISNSKKLENKDRARELNLLSDTIKSNNGNQTLIYFSTYSVDSVTEMNKDYVNHKLEMEEFIRDNSAKYLIIRTSNIVGSKGNDATVFRYLLNKTGTGEQFELWINTVRNFLDVDHLAAMVIEAVQSYQNNCTRYLINPVDIRVLDLMNIIESFTGIKANYIINEMPGNSITVDKTDSINLFKKLNLETSAYIENLLEKYYGNERG